MHQSRLAAGLRPDPVRELTALPKPPKLDLRGPLRGRNGRGEKGKKRDMKAEKRKGREEKGREAKGTAASTFYG